MVSGAVLLGQTDATRAQVGLALGTRTAGLTGWKQLTGRVFAAQVARGSQWFANAIASRASQTGCFGTTVMGDRAIGLFLGAANINMVINTKVETARQGNHESNRCADLK